MREQSEPPALDGSALPATAEEVSLDQLVQEARAGDAQAFGLIYTRLLERMYRFFAYRTNDPSLAEDLTEEVFLRAWEALPRYQERDIPFTVWLFRLARNLLIDHYRRTRTQSATLQRLTPAIPPHPEDLALQRLALEGVGQALRGLAEEQRLVVLLRIVEGYSTAETAAALGRSEQAVRALLYRALRTLRSRLEVQT